MMFYTSTDVKTNYRILVIFMALWIFINLFQSFFTGLYADEAYYWVYSTQLQWGYFDHPPMVALGIRLGDFFVHNTMFTRLGTVLFSAGTIYFLHLALPTESNDTKTFVLIFLSVIVFHVYGFVATPDAALFFFTALYFYAYKLFLQKDSAVHTLFLGLCLTGLLYSKYHGVLPVFFTLLSYPKLVYRRSAWLAVLIAVAGFIPHLYWQYMHDWPTFRYHLSERVASNYRISKTTSYLGGQILVWGPLTTLPVFYQLLKTRYRDVYLRAHAFTLWGVLLFFFLSSFKSAIEPHWTLVAGVSFVIVVQNLLAKTATDRFKKLFFKLATGNLVLIVALRILLVLPQSPVSKVNNLKPIFFARQWADELYKAAQETPVVFIDNYGDPALYQYYHPEVQATSYNTINYRKNQYSISNNEKKLHGKNVYIVTDKKIDSSDIFFPNSFRNISLHPFPNFTAINSLKIKWLNTVAKGISDQVIPAQIMVRNTSSFTLTNTHPAILGYTFFKTRKEKQTTQTTISLLTKAMPAGQEERYSVPIRFPKEKGTYKLLFSVVMPPFDGTIASNFYTIEIE